MTSRSKDTLRLFLPMTRLSVNINKFATLRNARGGNKPDLLDAARKCEQFGADGITVHPRPDERHIRRDDVLTLSEVVTAEFNIEGYPDERYLELIARARPAQATLVPDPPEALTSDSGWDLLRHRSFLTQTTKELKSQGVRVSLFVDPQLSIVEAAAQVGADRIELYTGPYARRYVSGRERAAEAYVEAAEFARQLGLEVNAGHDLDLMNLKFLKQQIPFLKEVSIGHALICDCLQFGLQETIRLYREQLK